MEITTPVMRVFMGKMRIYHQNLGGTLYAQKVMVFYGGNVGGTLHEKFVNQKLWDFLPGRLEHIQTPTFCGFDGGGGGGFMSFCFSKQRVIHGGAKNRGFFHRSKIFIGAIDYCFRLLEKIKGKPPTLIYDC
jgi:hypothetical protein